MEVLRRWLRWCPGTAPSHHSFSTMGASDSRAFPVWQVQYRTHRIWKAQTLCSASQPDLSRTWTLSRARGGREHVIPGPRQWCMQLHVLCDCRTGQIPGHRRSGILSQQVGGRSSLTRQVDAARGANCAHGNAAFKGGEVLCVSHKLCPSVQCLGAADIRNRKKLVMRDQSLLRTKRENLILRVPARTTCSWQQITPRSHKKLAVSTRVQSGEDAIESRRCRSLYGRGAMVEQHAKAPTPQRAPAHTLRAQCGVHTHTLKPGSAPGPFPCQSVWHPSGFAETSPTAAHHLPLTRQSHASTAIAAMKATEGRDDCSCWLH